MSERELNRVEVLVQVDDCRLTIDNAANLLNLTRRQVFRLLKRYRLDGAAAIRHKARGKPPEQPDSQSKARLCFGVDQRKLCGFRADIGRREVGRTSRLQGLA